MVSCQCPSVVWLGTGQQVNYTERSLFTLPSVCLCVFSLIDFLLSRFVTLNVHGAVFEVMWKHCESDYLFNASKFFCLPCPYDFMTVESV